MRIFVIDPESSAREVISGLVYDATRGAFSRTVRVDSGDFQLLRDNAAGDPPDAVLLGPGCYVDIEKSVERVHGFYPELPLGVILTNELYQSEAEDLRKYLRATIIALSDLEQLSQFLLGVEKEETKQNSIVLGVVGLKGGVGVSTTALGLAREFSEKRVALVDLNDINPDLTRLAAPTPSQREVLSEMLQAGVVSPNRLRELETRMTIGDRSVGVFGQPELYRESFHFKADILEDAPSSADYVTSLLEQLRINYDVVVIDFGMSWGVASFALLPLCDQLLFHIGVGEISARASLDNLTRLYRESDDPREFDLRKWWLVLSGSDAQLVAGEICEERELAFAGQIVLSAEEIEYEQGAKRILNALTNPSEESSGPTAERVFQPTAVILNPLVVETESGETPAVDTTPPVVRRKFGTPPTGFIDRGEASLPAAAEGGRAVRPAKRNKGSLLAKLQRMVDALS